MHQQCQAWCDRCVDRFGRRATIRVPGVLFLWRKKDTTKLYVQSHPFDFDDLSKLVESNWSCVLFCGLSVPDLQWFKGTSENCGVLKGHGRCKNLAHM